MGCKIGATLLKDDICVYVEIEINSFRYVSSKIAFDFLFAPSLSMISESVRRRVQIAKSKVLDGRTFLGHKIW